MQLRAGSETMVINRQTMLKTNKGDFRVSEKDVTLKPGARMKFINNWSLVDEICPEDNCRRKAIDINVTIETKARNPFFLSLVLVFTRVHQKAGLMQSLQLQDLSKSLSQV